MAVVESAADGLALSMPALGIAVPRNFAHLVPDPNLDQSLQDNDHFLLHHHHLHHHHHHHHLYHQHNLLHQQNIQKLPQFCVDQAQQPNVYISRSLANSETTLNLKISDGKTGQSESLAQINGDNQTLTDGGETLTCIPSVSHTQILADEHTVSDGKPLNLANGSPVSKSGPNADPSTQFGADKMRELEDLLSKLNPLAEEFVPSSFCVLDASKTTNDGNHKKKNGYTQGRRRVNGRTSKAQREECIRRTVYVSDIDQQVTEEQLAALFITCGPVVDCRVCGDPNSVLRFAFVEFMNEGGARAALGLAGTMLGYYPVRVLPSKTAIVPVNPTFLPRSEDEREMCARTIYCTNIDKKVSQADVKLFFESSYGEVARLRLLGDYRHSTRIAFVEFVRAESAMAALNCSGAILGSLPLRVSPSKTPVRPRSPRAVPQ